MTHPNPLSSALSETQKTVLNAIAEEIAPRFHGEPSGHDWFHVQRVRDMARRLAEKEGAEIYTVELAALLHDVGDWKFHDGDETVAGREIHRILSRHGVETDVLERVVKIIDMMGFKGGNRAPMGTIEGKVVQDADRLDAIGAVGIARAFAYGGHKGRILHDPGVPPMTAFTKEEYRKSAGPTLNHFYEKLFKLKDLMNTGTALAIAEKRHAFLEKFLRRFLSEWEGRDA